MKTENSAIVLHGEHDLKRLLNTIVAPITELGVSEMQLRDHLVLINRSDHSQPSVIHMPLLLIKKSPLSIGEIRQIRNLPAVAGNELLFLPDSVMAGAGSGSGPMNRSCLETRSST